MTQRVLSQNRYIRQELVIGAKNQEKIKKATVAVVGLGALGSNSAQLLARAGVGTLILIDRDVVELQNLQRQVLYCEQDIGKPKALAAQTYLKNINSSIKIQAYATDLHPGNITTLLKNVSIIVDGTDNFTTRFLINEFSVKKKKIWIYGACVQDQGRVIVFNLSKKSSKPCFACLFKPATGLKTCETSGILNTVASITASLQVQEALHVITQNPYTEELLCYNAKNATLEKFKLKNKSGCSVCKKKQYSYLSGNTQDDVIKFCGTSNYQFKANIEYADLKKRFQKIGTIQDHSEAFIFQAHPSQTLTVFKDGRVLIKADSESEAKKLFAKYIGA